MWWHTVTHGTGSEGETGEWSGYPVLFILPRNMVYPALLMLIRTPRLPVVDWTDAPADLNGLVRFVERRNLVSAHVPSHFKRSITQTSPRELLHCAFFTYLTPLKRVLVEKFFVPRRIPTSPLPEPQLKQRSPVHNLNCASLTKIWTSFHLNLGLVIANCFQGYKLKLCMVFETYRACNIILL
jgi:hypothetical protein